MKTLAYEQLDAFAQEIAKEIMGADPFCLWLSGDLGAGKTTLSGRILYALGLPRHLPVTSPTFTYFNEYQIGDQWFGHMDLYRAGDDFVLEELGVADIRTFRGFLVEWPEQVPANPLLKATHHLAIKLTDHPELRQVEFRSALD